MELGSSTGGTKLSILVNALGVLRIIISELCRMCQLRVVKRGIPVLPDRLASHAAQGGVHLVCGTLVADVELFQCLRIGVVAARFGLALGAHRGDTQRGHVVADGGRLAGGVGDVHVVVEDAHGKGGLRSVMTTFGWNPPFSEGRIRGKLTLYFVRQ